jgi:invasion protein IalB
MRATSLKGRSVKAAARLALSAFLLLATAGLGLAQQAPKSKTPAAQATPAPSPSPSASPPASATPGWAARCSSASRDAPLECAIEQNAILTKTGQLFVVVNIRVPGDTRAPVAFVQLPLGLNLPAGAKFQVDDGKTVDLPIQTCENSGCYASTPVAPELLGALKSGKQLKVSFQNLAKETITVPMPLNDFAAAYEKIR